MLVYLIAKWVNSYCMILIDENPAPLLLERIASVYTYKYPIYWLMKQLDIRQQR